MAHALVAICLGALLGGVLTADSATRRPPRLVAYLGAGVDARSDFDYFVGLARKAHSLLPEDVRFELFASAGDSLAALQAAVDGALAAHAVLIVAPTSRSARVAAERVRTTPIVFTSNDDPVRYGVIESMQRRRQPVAGIYFGDRLDGKRLELLHDAYPDVHRVAVLGDEQWVRGEDGRERVVAEGARLGLEVTALLAESEPEVRALLDSPQAARFDAWYVPTTNVSAASLPTVVEGMRRLRRPCIYAWSGPVIDGGLMAYSQDLGFIWPGTVELVARVLAGEDAGAIPIVRPQRFVLSVRTGPETGVSAPAMRVVRRADVVYR